MSVFLVKLFHWASVNCSTNSVECFSSWRLRSLAAPFYRLSKARCCCRPMSGHNEPSCQSLLRSWCVDWAVREAAPFSARFLHTAYSCLEVLPVPQDPKDESLAGFSWVLRAHQPSRSPGPLCIRNWRVPFQKSYFFAPLTSNSPPPLPPPLSLLWNPRPRCDFLCFLWLGICRFPITQLRCLLEKPKKKNPPTFWEDM